MNEDIEKFETTKSKPAIIFIAGFTGFLGLIGLLAFAKAMPHLGADDIFSLVFAAGMIAFTVLFLKYSFNPPWQLTDRDLTVRRFFGAKTIPYEEIYSLGTFRKTFRPKKADGRKMKSVLTTHHLAVETRDGKTKTFTLPSFASNSGLLDSLAKRSGKVIEKLPDEIEKVLNPPA